MTIFRRTAVGLVAAALAGTAAVVVVPAEVASGASQSYTNACRNSAAATNWDQIDVTMTATSPTGPVAPGMSVPLTKLSLKLAIPGLIFVVGYNFGLLKAGVNNIPATLHAVIDAPNTTELSQSTNAVDSTITTTITDPDAVKGSGDETATPAQGSVTFSDMTWTAGASGVISFAQHNDTAINGLTGGGIVAVAHLGIINPQFHCTSGTVAGSNPGTPTFVDAPVITSTPITLAPVNTARPAITGTPKPGSTLTCSDGIWANTPTGFTRQWYRSGAPLNGATATTYKVVTADLQRKLTCGVIATNGEGPSSEAMSLAATVKAPTKLTATETTKSGAARACGASTANACRDSHGAIVYMAGKATPVPIPAAARKVTLAYYFHTAARWVLKKTKTVSASSVTGAWHLAQTGVTSQDGMWRVRATAAGTATLLAGVSPYRYYRVG